ncbi:GRF zinc finger-domain-containing protein [Endogone sp. FLAS-F59071]|nr:GRF zinc finger-domain-containing protein [Endogone sp. FLAS-F59071]|eukprot:RUS13119.1 GRF zinc finger-domain-containing protein [Endogone sp. FLAS-F59071]
MPTTQRTVKKEGPNQGKQFFCCTKLQSDTSRCNFFSWADQISTERVRGGGEYAERRANSGISVDVTAPSCNCGRPAVQRTVMKDTQNKGRKFYGCASFRDGGCDFLQWEDENEGGNGDRGSSGSWSGNGGGGGGWNGNGSGRGGWNGNGGRGGIQGSGAGWGGTGGGGSRSFRDGSFQSGGGFAGNRSGVNVDEDDDGLVRTDPNTLAAYRSFLDQTDQDASAKIKCQCNLIAAIRTVAKVDSPNRGKQFYCCPKESQIARCKFFQLVDGDEGNSSGAWGAGAGLNRNGSGSNWGGANAGTSMGECYKCGQPGHYANACTNQGGYSNRGRGRGSRGGRKQGGTGRGRGRGKRGRGRGAGDDEFGDD